MAASRGAQRCRARKGTLPAIARHMHKLSSIVLGSLACLLSLSGCVAALDEPTDNDLGVVTESITATPSPLCPDKHFKVQTLDGNCDHWTVHYTPMFQPPPGGIVCVETSREVRTTPGPCFDLPPPPEL